jgi:hypothetical protein
MLAPAVRKNSSQLVPLDVPGRQSRKSLFGLDAEALAACMVEAGEPAWRGRQLAEALYRQRIAELEAITTLPKALRQRLAAEGWQVGRPAITQVFQSADGTERYLVESQGCRREMTARPATEVTGRFPKRRVPQVRGPHGQVFVRRLEFRIFGPGKPTNPAPPKNQPTAPRSASPAR